MSAGTLLGLGPQRIVGPEVGGEASGKVLSHLAGASMAGLQSGRRNQAEPTPERPPSLERYFYSLTGAYWTTQATPPTLRAVAEPFRARGNARVVVPCLGVADDEARHNLLVLEDLDALGLRSAELVSKVHPVNAMAWIGLFRRLAEGPAPISVLGYAFALEWCALFRTPAAISAIESILPAGTTATRCLGVHSAAGTDARHVGQSFDFRKRLSLDDSTAFTESRCSFTWQSLALGAVPSVALGPPGRQEP